MKKLLIALTIVLLAITTIFVYALLRRGVLKESSQPPVRVAQERRETGFTLPNGENGEIVSGDTRKLVTNAEIVSVSEPQDEVFPETSIRIKIGYYDNSGEIHVYPARLGGSFNDGAQMKVGFCSVDQNPNCQTSTAQDVLSGLTEGEIFQIQLLHQVGFDWTGAQQINKYSDFYTELKNALSTGDNFPEPPDSNDFVLQVSQVRAD